MLPIPVGPWPSPVLRPGRRLRKTQFGQQLPVTDDRYWVGYCAMTLTTPRRMKGAAARLGWHALFTLSVAAFATSVSGQGVGPSGYTTAEIKSFGAALQAAVASRRPGAVASLVHFPLRVSYRDGTDRQVNRAQFVAGYPTIFDRDVQAAIMTEDLDHVFERDQGIMFGLTGMVWASGICIRKDCSVRPPLKVITVNLSHGRAEAH
jgi:hypothetical protein